MNEQQTNPQQPNYPPYTSATTQQPYYMSYNAPPVQPKKSRWWLWLIIGLAALGLIIWGAVAAQNASQEMLDSLEEYDDAPSVAVLHVEGTISSASADSMYETNAYNHQFILDSIDELIYDEYNEGLLVYIDSPGGEVLATTEVADKLLEYADTGRPVYAYGHNYAASGGYWIAAAADRIYLNRYCTTGSIGVTYGSLLDLSGLLEKYGIKVNTLTSGAQKAMGSSLETMSDETRAIFQAIINEYYGYFTDWVCERRQMSQEQLLPLADGRIYTAKQAVENGLADQVGAYGDCLNDLLAQCGEDCLVNELYPPEQFSWASLFQLSTEQQQLNALLELAPPSGPLALYRQ